MRILRAALVLLPVLALGVLAQAGPAVSIQSIQPDGEDEVVTIVNGGDQPVDLSGWRLESSNSLGQEVKETFWFPTGCLLPAHGILRVHSGPYARSWGDRSCGHQQIDLPWTEVKIWNDEADVAWLRDPFGELIDLYTYTAAAAAEVLPPPRPLLRPKPWPEACYRWPEPTSGVEWYCSPPPAAGGCCAVRVVLVSIEPVYNQGVGENWRFFASAGRMEPPVFPENLPQAIYEDRFRGELSLQIGAGAVEEDRWPDRGWASRTIHLYCPSPCQAERVIVIDVRVRENEGCYAGCAALWRFTFKVIVAPRFAPTVPPPPPPSADFTVSPPGAHRVGDVVTLDGSSSRGEGLSYEWDLDGDGRTDARGVKVSHRLAHEGMNLITLTVTDRWGRSDSITRGIRAKAPYPEKAEGRIDLGLFWLTLPALAVGYFLATAFRG